MKLNDPSYGNKFKEGQRQIDWLCTVAVKGLKKPKQIQLLVREVVEPLKLTIGP